MRYGYDETDILGVITKLIFFFFLSFFFLGGGGSFIYISCLSLRSRYRIGIFFGGLLNFKYFMGKPDIISDIYLSKE